MSMRTPRPSRTSRFSNGMRSVCARISDVSVSSVGDSGPRQPMRSKYRSALNKFDLRTVRIDDERVVHLAGGELEFGRALHHGDAFEIGERLVEVRHAPAEMIERAADARRRRRLRFLHEQ